MEAFRETYSRFQGESLRFIHLFSFFVCVKVRMEEKRRHWLQNAISMTLCLHFRLHQIPQRDSIHARQTPASL